MDYPFPNNSLTPLVSDGQDRSLRRLPWMIWSMLTGDFPVIAVGKSDIAVKTFIRLGTTPTYGAGKAIASSTGTVIEIPNFFRVAGGTATILNASLIAQLKGLTAQHRIHFFSEAPATVAADAADWDARYADAGKRLGSIDLPAMASPEAAASDQSSASLDAVNLVVKAKADSRSLFIGLKAITLYNLATTAGMGYTVKLTSYQD